MTGKPCLSLFLLASAISVFALSNPPPARDKAVYKKHVPDPVLTALEKGDKKRAEEALDATKTIEDSQEELKKKEKDTRKDLRVDMTALAKPSSPASFRIQAWHFPPVPQYLTGTCWAFSTTSYFESEIHRLTGREVKLSEMWTVYHEYIEKARRYVETRGHSVFEEGSESEALPRIWKRYGVVPESVYRGILDPEGRFDHEPMVKEMKAYLAYCKAHNYWNEKQIVATLALIMNKTMGAPPATFTYQGKTYTPQSFLKQVTGLKLDDYVSLMSTESIPFWTRGEFKVEDNWWHGKTYINVPLSDWYEAILRTAKAGASVAIGGDVSEAGYDGYEKVAIVPTFDLPGPYIDQDARELRIARRSTTDDHGIHLVGWQHLGDHDWFLIKDSARAARKAEPYGYLFYRGDYVRLKMLTIMTHKDFVKELVSRVGDAPPVAGKESPAVQ